MADTRLAFIPNNIHLQKSDCLYTCYPVKYLKLIIIFEHVCPQQVAGVCVALKPPATERIRSLQWKCDEIEVFSLNYDNGLDSDTGS